MTNAFGLTQMVPTATRTTRLSSSLIDLIFISDPELVREVCVSPLHNVSDHDLVSATLILDNPIPNNNIYREYRSYRKFDYDAFQHDLNQIPFFYMYDMNSVDDKANWLSQNLMSLMDRPKT
ncbi:Endonuclease-reverse transcriptase [Popillia japonica]